MIKASIGPAERRSWSQPLSCLTGITVYSSEKLKQHYLSLASLIKTWVNSGEDDQYCDVLLLFVLVVLLMS